MNSFHPNSPKSLLLFILFFVASISFLQIVGETILTDGTENAIPGNENVQQVLRESFFTKSVPIQFYLSVDQCEAQQNNAEIMPMALVFFLPPEAMNAGEGITICYKSQLDGMANVDKGLSTPIGLRVNNKEANEVVKICGHGLHGFQLKEAANGQKLVLTMSTTNNRFVLDRSQFSGGIFVLNLARWNSLVREFAVQTDLDKRGHPNFVNISADWALKTAYLRNVGRGAKLNEYFGLWALGVDMLPGEYANEEPFKLFINRSICSEMAVSFKLPFDPAQSKITQKKPHKPLGINVTSTKTLKIPDGSDLVVRGKVDANPDHFLLQMRTGTEDMPKILAFRLHFYFKENKVVMERFVDGQWIAVDKPKKNKLKGNQQFRLKAIVQQFQLKVSINCGQFEEFSLGMSNKEKKILIEKEVGFKFGFNGNVEIYSVEFRGEQLVEWVHGEMMSKEFTISAIDNQGILIRAYILPDLEWSIDIELASEEGNKFKIYTNSSQSNSIRFQSKSDNGIKKLNQINAGAKFEIHFLVHPEQIDVILMGNYTSQPFINFTNEEDKIKITSVKINASFDPGSLFFNETFSTPSQFVLPENNYFEKNSILTLHGKIPNNAIQFDIDFADFDQKPHPEIYVCSSNSKDAPCKIPLRIWCDFRENSTTLRRLEFNATVSSRNRQWSNIVELKPNPFQAGMEFALNITADFNAFHLAVQPLNMPDKLTNYSYPSNNFRIKMIEVHGDIFIMAKPIIVS